MNKKFLIVGLVVLFVVLLVAILYTPKNEVKEELLGINYNIDGNESKLNYDTENSVVAMYIEG